ncbi:hypothetical protein [Amycolatopsis solani]|uniref:hypothetical protein n=1 Tax=Amycolatopsis solani TaxID=3028615 RepID=UPI0025B0CC56|nr:hypothetical protein [Amycolatopsis sp. MEP2-6]
MTENNRPARLALTAAVVALLLSGTGILVRQGFPARPGGTVAGIEVTGVPAVVRPAPEPAVTTPLTRRTGSGADIGFTGGVARLRIAAAAPLPGFAAVVITTDGTRLLPAAYDTATRSIVADLPRPGRFWGGLLDLGALGRDVVPAPAARPGCVGRAASFGGVTVVAGQVGGAGGSTAGGSTAGGGGTGGSERPAGSGSKTGGPGRGAGSGGLANLGGPDGPGSATGSGTEGTTTSGNTASPGSTANLGGTAGSGSAAEVGSTTTGTAGATPSGSTAGSGNAASSGGTAGSASAAKVGNATTGTAGPTPSGSAAGSGNAASSGSAAGSGGAASSGSTANLGGTAGPGNAAGSGSTTVVPGHAADPSGETASPGQADAPVWVCVTAGSGRAGVTLTSNARVPYRVAVPSNWADSAARTGVAAPLDLLWPGASVSYEVPFARLPATLRGQPDPGPALGALLAAAAHRVAALFGSAVGSGPAPGVLTCAATTAAARYSADRAAADMAADVWAALGACHLDGGDTVRWFLAAGIGAVAGAPAAGPAFEVPVTAGRVQRFTQVLEYRAKTGAPASGRCGAVSAVSGRHDAYRCTSGGTTYDPCFATTESRVVCPTSVTGAVLLTYAGDLPSPPQAGGGGKPFLLVLANGLQCLAVAGGGYSCTDGRTRDVDTSSPMWTVDGVTVVKAYT